VSFSHPYKKVGVHEGTIEESLCRKIILDVQLFPNVADKKIQP